MFCPKPVNVCEASENKFLQGNFSERKSVDSSGKTIAFAYECASYHPQKNMWIKDCDTVSDPDAPEKGVLCNCKHNTSFAVLMVRVKKGKVYFFISLTTVLV